MQRKKKRFRQRDTVDIEELRDGADSKSEPENQGKDRVKSLINYLWGCTFIYLCQRMFYRIPRSNMKEKLKN